MAPRPSSRNGVSTQAAGDIDVNLAAREAQSIKSDPAEQTQEKKQKMVVLHFPLVALLSLAFSGLVYGLLAGYEGTAALEMAAVNRKLASWPQVTAIMAWRVSELGLAWFAGYDGYDIVSLSVLSRVPQLYLLNSFYNIRPRTVLSSLLIDALAVYIPFSLLRPLSPAHSSTSSIPSTAPNRELLANIPIQVYTTLLGAAIYSVILSAAFATFLPITLVTHFETLVDISHAYTAHPLSLLPLSLPLGLAAKSFIFTPAAAALPSVSAPVPDPTAIETKGPSFDPITASFGQTFWYNIWGHTNRTKVVMKRTAALVVLVAGNTLVQTVGTLEGVQLPGAIAYASVWALAAGATGAMFGIVGDV